MKTFSVVEYPPTDINCLALSPDSSQVVIAGRHVYKIFSIEENEFVEKANLRVGKNLHLDYSCRDVAWNPIDENLLATGTTNGEVVTWNLKITGVSKKDLVFTDHGRAVNKINFHPTDPTLLLSGSSAGVIKLFDLRKKGCVTNFISVGNEEAVRDLQFNPHDPHLFVAGIENGYVQLWDRRKPNKFEKHFQGYGGSVFSLDWHPENRMWLATGSRERLIQVWELGDPPVQLNKIKTTDTIACVRWRPTEKYHIASSALILDCNIYVWDIKRPNIPLASFNKHKNDITGIVWRDGPNSLLSVGKDSTLYHHSYADASRPVKNVNPVGLNVGSHGDVVFAVKRKEEVSEVTPIVTTPRQSKYSKKHVINENTSYITSNLKTLECKDSSIVSSKYILELALNYKLTGRSIADICEHNAAEAKKRDRMQDMTTWQTLQVLYGETAKDEPVRMPTGIKDDHRLSQDIAHDIDHKINRTTFGEKCDRFSEENDTEPDENENHVIQRENIARPDNFDFFGDGELREDSIYYDHFDHFDTSESLTLTQLPNEPFQQRYKQPFRTNTPPDRFHSNKENSSNIINRTNTEESSDYIVEPLANIQDIKPFTIKTMDYNDLVIEMLYHFVNNGNVQMAVTVIIVLGDKIIKFLDEDLVEYWFFSYIDMLHRLRLWNVATQIIQLATSIPSVQQMNQQSTTFSLQCGNCTHSIPALKYYCNKCSSNVSKCALCHKTVKGHYVWCQGCSHGGHIHHIQEWLKENKECPAGCGHLCQYT